MKNNDQAPKGKKENRLEKVIVFMLVVLISLLSFSVGVISGKGLSDKQFALESLDKKHSQALSGEDYKDEATADLSEEEIQQLANAALQAAQTDTEEYDASAEPSKAPASVTAAAPATGAKSVGSAAVDAVGATIASAPSEDNRAPTSVNKQAKMNLDYTVQVASYPSLTDAETMSTSLVKKGFPAFPIKVSIKGQDWYLVSVGSFKTKKEAMDYQTNLKKQGVVKDAVVQKLIK